MNGSLFTLREGFKTVQCHLIFCIGKKETIGCTLEVILSRVFISQQNMEVVEREAINESRIRL